MARGNKIEVIEFNRRRDRFHLGFILISYEELKEKGFTDDLKEIIMCKINYNGVLHSIRGAGTRGILIWELGKNKTMEA